MSEKKSQSFVQMKEPKNKTLEHDILNPLKEYKYIEPKKKAPIKQIILIFFIIIIIFLTIIFFILIDKKNTEINPNNTSVNNSQTTSTTKTTTKDANNVTTKKQNEETINSTLMCHSTTIDGDLEMTVQVTANFYENQLKSDINYMSIKLTNENSRTAFDKYVMALQMFAIYLAEDKTYEVSESTTDNEFILAIKTTYSENKQIESNLSYNESYESVKQKLIELGHTCE